MKSVRFIYVVILTCFLIGSIAGCGGSGGGGGSSTGILNLSITDASVDEASKVVVEFTGVILHSSSGDLLEFNYEDLNPYNAPRKIDLLALNGGGSEVLLQEVSVPSGHYNWIRLKVNADCDEIDSYIAFKPDPGPNDKYSLSISSGDQTGLKLVSGFDVPADDVVNFTIDFDLRKSVNKRNGQDNCKDIYKLKPALRLVKTAETGSIAGNVDPALINGTCTGGNAVYVFKGHDINPDDVDEKDPDPVTSALVKFDDDAQEYVYKAAFLQAGSYTISFTCQAGDDDPGSDDSIDFVGTENVSVTAGLVKTHNFQ